MQSSKECFKCSSGFPFSDLSFQCWTCDRNYLCDVCASIHSKTRNDHIIRDMAGRKPLFCYKHVNLVEHFCATCDEYQCNNCSVSCIRPSSQHELLSIKDKLILNLKEIEAKHDHEDRVKSLLKETNNLTDHEFHTLVMYLHNKRMIRHRFEILHQTVDAGRDESVQVLEEALMAQEVYDMCKKVFSYYTDNFDEFTRLPDFDGIDQFDMIERVQQIENDWKLFDLQKIRNYIEPSPIEFIDNDIDETRFKDAVKEAVNPPSLVDFKPKGKIDRFASNEYYVFVCESNENEINRYSPFGAFTGSMEVAWKPPLQQLAVCGMKLFYLNKDLVYYDATTINHDTERNTLIENAQLESFAVHESSQTIAGFGLEFLTIWKTTYWTNPQTTFKLRRSGRIENGCLDFTFLGSIAALETRDNHRVLVILKGPNFEIEIEGARQFTTKSQLLVDLNDLIIVCDGDDLFIIDHCDGHIIEQISHRTKFPYKQIGRFDRHHICALLADNSFHTVPYFSEVI